MTPTYDEKKEKKTRQYYIGEVQFNINCKAYVLLKRNNTKSLKCTNLRINESDDLIFKSEV